MDWTTPSVYDRAPATTLDERHARAFRQAAQRNPHRAAQLMLSASLLTATTEAPRALMSDREIYAAWACVGGDSSNRGDPRPRKVFNRSDE